MSCSFWTSSLREFNVVGKSTGVCLRFCLGCRGITSIGACKGPGGSNGSQSARRQQDFGAVVGDARAVCHSTMLNDVLASWHTL